MAHTAGERPGVAEEAIHFWNHLTGWAEAYNVDKTRRFDALDPSLPAIHSGDDALQQWVEMDVAFRLPPGLAVETLLNQVEVWRGDAQVECRSHEPRRGGMEYLPPFVGGKGNVLCSALLHAIRAEGGQPAFVLKTGTSDMNVVGPVWKCPIVAYGPGDSALDHTPEEHLDLREYLQSIRVLTRALRRLAQQ
jgi:LysW-gamma-L-lysine carboxypeptidase